MYGRGAQTAAAEVITPHYHASGIWPEHCDCDSLRNI